MVLLSSVAHAIDIQLSGPLPPVVREIELSYVGEHTTPTVTLKGPPESSPSLLYRPFVPILNLLPDLEPPRVFGACRGDMSREPGQQGVRLAFADGGHGRCGQRFAFRPTGGMLDVLSYATLHLRGRATGRLTLALEDLAASRREDNVPVATIDGPFDLVLPLREISRHLDMRKLTALVVTTEESSGDVILEQCHIESAPPATNDSAHMGFWAWNYRAAAADPEALLATCRRQGCSRVLIQMPSLSDDDSLWAAYARVFTKAHEAGIDVWALDGYPEAIQEPQKLADKIHRLLPLVEPRALAGVQLDIEPYLLPGFFGDESGPRRYLEAIDFIKETIGGRTRLSVVIPFWLATPTVGGRPLAFSVMDRADEVAVMSYRTNLDELGDISEDILRYGDLVSIPVWLAVETTPLPVEHRVTLTRHPRLDLADAVLDRDRRRLTLAPFPAPLSAGAGWEGFRIQHRVTVRPERLTFAGQSQTEVAAAVETLLHSVSHRSFSGVMIHDLDGFRALAE